MPKAKMQTKKTCPRCGRPMEEFAVAWGWKYCYDCCWKHYYSRLGWSGNKHLENERRDEQ